MRFQHIFHNKNIIIFGISVLVLSFIYFLLRLIVFDSDPLIPFLSFIDNFWLFLAEKFANFLLHWTDSPISIENHSIIINNTPIGEVKTVTILKKWGVLLLLIFWLTKTSLKSKTLFTIFLVLINFLLLSIEVALATQINSLESDYGDFTFIIILRTIGVLSMTTILFTWYWRNKGSILNSLTKLKINTELFENKFTAIVVFTYLYALIGIFLLQYFDYHWWINFLFGSSKSILSLFGYKATVEPFLLVGDNGTIYMAKYCLGFKTMLLFASVVYITGYDNKRRWSYIFAGLIFLNFVNIMRFVFLFIHIQKHGDYILAMDLHDMYKYITYLIVFILWVIWFEKFADYNLDKKTSYSRKKTQFKI